MEGDYFKVYSTNADKTGTLGEKVTRQAVLAYTLAMSVIEDLRTIDKPFESREKQIAYYEEMVTVLKLATNEE